LFLTTMACGDSWESCWRPGTPDTMVLCMRTCWLGGVATGVASLTARTDIGWQDRGARNDLTCWGDEEEDDEDDDEDDDDDDRGDGEEVATTMVAPAGTATFLCLAGGTTSWASTLALLTDFSTTARQIS